MLVSETSVSTLIRALDDEKPTLLQDEWDETQKGGKEAPPCSGSFTGALRSSRARHSVAPPSPILSRRIPDIHDALVRGSIGGDLRHILGIRQ